MSNESIDYNLYMNNAYSIEAIKMTKDEFEQRKNEIKEAAGKVYDKAVEFFRSKFDATVRPKLEGLYEKMKSKGKIDENETLEEFVKKAEGFIILNDKSNFVNSFVSYIENGEKDKEACKIFTIDTDKIPDPNLKKSIVGVLVSALTMFIGALLTINFPITGILTFLSGGVGTFISAKKITAGKINQTVNQSFNNDVKKSIKPESKLSNSKGKLQNFVSVKKKITKEGAVFYLIPKITIKG